MPTTLTALLRNDSTLSLNGFSTNLSGLTIQDNAGIDFGNQGQLATNRLSATGSLPVTLNGSLSISDELFVGQGSKVVVDSATSLTDRLDIEGSLIVNAPLSTNHIEFADGQELTVNSSLEVSGFSEADIDVVNGTLNLNPGGEIIADGLALVGGVFNRSGGSIRIRERLLITGNQSFELLAQDAVGFLDIRDGSRVELQSSSPTDGVSIATGSELALNGNDLSVSFLTLSGQDALIVRTANEQMDTGRLAVLAGKSFNVDENVSVRSSLAIQQDASVAISTPLDLDSSISVTLRGDLVSDAPLASSDLTVDGSFAAFNDTLRISGDTLIGSGSRVSASGDFLTSGDTLVTGSSELEVLNANFRSDGLTLRFGSAAVLSGEVAVGGDLDIDVRSAVSFSQSEENPLGIIVAGSVFISEDSELRLAFDDEVAPGIDWLLRVDGNQVDSLLALLGDRILVEGGEEEASVIFDPERFGNFTFVGVVTVPEPTTILMAGLFCLSQAFCRRKCFA